MRYQRFGERFVVRLESGEPVMATLTGFLGEHGIGFANVSAAGAVSAAELGYWHADRQSYDYRKLEEQLEVVSFQGTASLKDGKPFLHVHGVFGRADFSAVAGHVKEAWTHPTFEAWLRIEDVPVKRIHDQSTGLDLLDLPSQ